MSDPTKGDVLAGCFMVLLLSPFIAFGIGLIALFFK